MISILLTSNGWRRTLLGMLDQGGFHQDEDSSLSKTWVRGSIPLFGQNVKSGKPFQK